MSKEKNTNTPDVLFEHLGSGLKDAASLLAKVGLNASPLASEKHSRQSAQKMSKSESNPTVATQSTTHSNLVESIVAIAAQLTPSKKLSADDDFFMRGGNSLQAVELVSRLAKELGVSMTLDDIFADARPIRIAERWLQRQGLALPNNDTAESRSEPLPRPPQSLTLATPTTSRRPKNSDVKSARFEQLSDELKQTQKEDIQLIQEDLTLADGLPWVESPMLRAPKRILLTGATGFLGSHVLFDLLRHSDAHIVCLVRAPNEQAAEERLKLELEKRDFPWSNELQRRISVVPGDLKAQRLGWNEAEWEEYAASLDSIVNVAAAVDFVRGYSSLREMNVLGVLTLAELATSQKMKPLHQVSSLAIFDEYNINAIGENEPPARIDRLFSGYDKTKWVSEALLRRARERGLCVTFLRPGGINGNTQTGVYNPHDLSSGIIAAIQSMRILPEFNYLNVAPVDWISRIISDIVVDPDAWGDNYHLIGEPVSLEQQVREASLSGMAVKVTSFSEWRERFLRRMEDNPIPELGFLQRALQSQATVKLMEAVFSWPPASADNVDALIARRNLPVRPKNDGLSQIETLERLVRDGRASLPGKTDTPYLQFHETMRGHLDSIDGTKVNEPCEFSLQLSVASFYQVFRDRRVDIRGTIACKLLHTSPLQITCGDLWFRPNEGIPVTHSLSHPLIKYRLHLQADDQSEWWMEGLKLTAPGLNQWQEGRTLHVTAGKKNQPASLRGTMIVPADTYFKEQIEGITVNPNVSLQEQQAAKMIWLAWFGGQLAQGYLNPLLRVAGGLIDSFRTFKK